MSDHICIACTVTDYSAHKHSTIHSSRWTDPNQHFSEQFNPFLTRTYLKISTECQLKRAGTLLHVALVQGQTCHQQMGLDRVAVVADAPLQ